MGTFVWKELNLSMDTEIWNPRQSRACNYQSNTELDDKKCYKILTFETMIKSLMTSGNLAYLFESLEHFNISQYQ